jgi:hypothetical protein
MSGGEQQRGGGAPKRNARGWVGPVEERYNLLVEVTNSNAQYNCPELTQALDAFAEKAIDVISTHEHDVGLTIQALDALRDVHAKFMAALALPEIKRLAQGK